MSEGRSRHLPTLGVACPDYGQPSPLGPGGVQLAPTYQWLVPGPTGNAHACATCTLWTSSVQCAIRPWCGPGDASWRTQPSERRRVSSSVVTVVRDLVSVNITDAVSVVQPARDPGICEQPPIHVAADDVLWTPTDPVGATVSIAVIRWKTAAPLTMVCSGRRASQATTPTSISNPTPVSRLLRRTASPFEHAWTAPYPSGWAPPVPMPRGGASKNRTYDLVIISDAL